MELPESATSGTAERPLHFALGWEPATFQWVTSSRTLQIRAERTLTVMMAMLGPVESVPQACVMEKGVWWCIHSPCLVYTFESAARNISARLAK